MNTNLENFTDVLGEDEIANSQPLSLPSSPETASEALLVPFIMPIENQSSKIIRPAKCTGQHGDFRSVEEIDPKYRHVFSYPYFNLVQSRVIEDALYSDKSMVLCAPTGSGKTVVFEMAIVQLLMELEDKNYTGDFKIIYMAPVKALCTERLSEWYPKFTKLGLLCIEVTGDTNVDFSQLTPYRIIITTPEKWDMLTRRWRDHRSLVEVIKLFLIDEVHILNDDTRGPVLEAVVSRMKTIEASSQSAHRIEKLQKQYQDRAETPSSSKQEDSPRIRFVAVSATVSNPEDVAAWLGTRDKPAVYYTFGDECRPVKLRRVVEGYPCPDGMSIFKFDIILNYKLWPLIQRYHNGKPTLIFCNTRKSVAMTAETLSRELTINFTPDQMAKLTALANTIKNKKLQALVLSGVGCHHAGLLYEERLNIEDAFRNRDLPILITTTTLAMGVNLPAHLVIIKNTQQYVNGAYQEYSISTVLQMVGRAGRPQFDTDATAVIMTRMADKSRYQALVGGDEPLQSYLHKRLPENLNSEAALGTVGDVAQCVQWLRSTFLSVRAAKDPKRYLGLPMNAAPALISKKIEELCVKAMNGLASAGLISMDEASCIESTEAGRLMSIFYLDLETMKHIMKIKGSESLEQLLWIVCESHELADMHLRVDERRTLNTLNRNNAAATIRFPMKGKITTRQMKLNCMIQAVLGCLPIPDPALNQEAMKVMRIADRVCKCLVAYVTRPEVISTQPQYYSAVLNSLMLAKCIQAHLWEDSPYVSKQLKGIGPTFSALLASAGKVKFNLLQESHPRDLERIMNKGAPAGNIICKQISLLPQYQLTANPVDEKRVSIRLMLINQHYLAENRQQLTAGDSHKCNIVVGDSDNHLLLFTSFKDRDLISIYDGNLTFEITRRHSFEHKILIHCMSSDWVGLDVQSEYVFKNIEPTFLRIEALQTLPIENTPRKTNKKQTCITDTYKERKRKINDSDVTQCKEKKKRDTALLEKFKTLKDSFEITSNELKRDLQNTSQISDKLKHEIVQREKWGSSIETNTIETAMRNIDENYMHTDQYNMNTESVDLTGSNYDLHKSDVEDLNDEDSLIVDNRIDSILNEIESEIYKEKSSNAHLNTHPSTSDCKKFTNKSPRSCDSPKMITQVQMLAANSHGSFPKLDVYRREMKKRKTVNTKSNYSFIDSIEKNENLSSNYSDISQKEGGFSDAIKNQIEKFLQNTSHTKGRADLSINKLLDCAESTEKLCAKVGASSPLDILTPNILTTEDTTSMLPLTFELPAVCINPEQTKERNTITTSKTNIYNCNNIIQRQDNKPPCDLPINLKIDKDHNEEKDVAILPETKTNVIIAISDHTGPKEKHKDHIQEANFIDFYKHGSTNNARGENSNDARRYNMAVENNCLKQTDSNGSKNHDVEVETKNSQGYAKESLDNNMNERSLVPITNSVKTEDFLLLPSKKRIDLLYKSVRPNNTLLFNQHVNTHISKDFYEPFKQSKTMLPLKITNGKDSTSTAADDIVHHSTSVARTPANNVCVEDCVNFRDLNKPQNVSKKHNEVSKGSNKAKHEYVSKYHFSAAKIDVRTQNASDHQLQIIRQVKLDFDVTEIVTTVDNIQNQPTDSGDEQTPLDKQNKEKESGIPEYRYLLPVKNNDHRTDLLTVKKGEENSIIEQIQEHPGKRFTQHNDEMTLENQETSTIIHNRQNAQLVGQYKVQSEQNKNEIHWVKGNVKNNTAQDIELKKSEKEDKTRLYYCHGNGSTGTDDMNKENKQSCTKVTNNKIENLLQKYSTLLRKSNNIPNNLETKINQDVVKQVKDKVKRPYKIGDIHSLNIPLPKTFIALEVARSRPTNDDILTKIRDTEKKENSPLVSVKTLTHGTPETSTTQQHTELHNITDNLDEEIPLYYHSPVSDIPHIESLEDFNLDQSMLNPKTLLQQCFSKDEDDMGNNIIIPPPSEFCDAGIYSPINIQDGFHDNFAHYESLNKEGQDSTSDISEDQSIFEDNVQSILTPTKEIETWNLPNEEETTETSSGNYQSHPAKSCTVMRKNSPFSQDTPCLYSNKQSVLGQFKFTHKKKLRL